MTARLLRHVHKNGPVIEEIDWVDPEAAFVPHAKSPGALWLDSADPTHHAARYSFIACNPYHTIAMADWQALSGFGQLDGELHRFDGLWDGLDKDGQEVKEGEIGEIFVTSLTNYLMPLIRYKIGDLAVKARKDRVCSCGRKLPILEKIIGRTYCLVKYIKPLMFFFVLLFKRLNSA